MTESNMDGSEPKTGKLSRSKFIVGGGLGAAVLAIANRGQIADALFPTDEGELIGPELAAKFPREILEFPEGKLAARDIKPEQLNEDTDVPMIIMMGLGVEQKVLGPFHKTFYEAGQHALAVDIVDGEGSFGTFNGTKEVDRQGDLLAEYIRKYSQEHPEVEQFDLLPFSLSTIRMLSFARRHPDLVPKIRLFMPAMPVGLPEKDSVAGVLGRQTQEMFRDAKVDHSEEAKRVGQLVQRAVPNNILKIQFVILRNFLLLPRLTITRP